MQKLKMNLILIIIVTLLFLVESKKGETSFDKFYRDRANIC